MPKLATWLTPDVADHAWMDTRWVSVHQDHNDDNTPFKRVMKSTVLKTKKGKKIVFQYHLCAGSSWWIPHLTCIRRCWTQSCRSLAGAGSGPGQWLRARRKTAGKPNGKYESWRLALRQTCPHSLPTSVKHQNVLTSKSQEAQLKHRNFVWK